MKCHLRSGIPRWWTISVVASILAVSLLAVSSLPTFAAACNPNLPLDASGGSAGCDMLIGAQINGGLLELTNDSAAKVVGSPFTLTGTNIAATFSFSATVEDHRGNTNGWRLQASSAGLTNGTTTLPLNLTSLDASSFCFDGSCSPATFTSVTPLTQTSATFLTAGNAAHSVVIDGDYTSKFNGQFTIPTGSPSGVYNGIITVTLSNTF